MGIPEAETEQASQAPSLVVEYRMGSPSELEQPSKPVAVYTKASASLVLALALEQQALRTSLAVAGK